jgi:uncharacterized protein YbaP (TraB family)
MKRTILLITSIIVATLFSNAQIFWKITKNGSDRASYLLGTHHLIEKDTIPGADKILSYVATVEMVVGEMEMNNMLGKQIKMLQAAIMKDSTISQLLTVEEYQLVDAQMKEVVGKGLDKMGKLKPVMLSMLYTVMLYKKENKLSKEPELIDLEVQKIAKKKKLRIIGLESVDEQINILMNSKSLNQQAQEFVETVKDKKKSIQGMQKLNEIYLKGNIESFIEVSKEDGQMDDEDLNILCYQRNLNWMGKLSKLISEKSCYIAVGCMHLVGEKGLIQLLQNEGYLVEPVKL